MCLFLLKMCIRDRNNGNDVCLKRDDKLYGTEIKKIDKPVVLVIGTGDRTNTVSYTHLDVYKRQCTGRD